MRFGAICLWAWVIPVWLSATVGAVVPSNLAHAQFAAPEKESGALAPDEQRAFEDMFDALARKPAKGPERAAGANSPANNRNASASATPQRTTTVAVQKWLKALGCYTGEIDGLWGPNSQRALAAAIGPQEAAAGATAANLARLEGVSDLEVCSDLAAFAPAPAAAPSQPQLKPEPKVTRRKKPGCMTYSQCMSGCSDGTLGRGSGAICTYVCGSEIPICR